MSTSLILATTSVRIVVFFLTADSSGGMSFGLLISTARCSPMEESAIERSGRRPEPTSIRCLQHHTHADCTNVLTDGDL